MQGLLHNAEGVEVTMRGQWAAHFGNDKPITLELACGGGEYAVGLARLYPERNFIGLDIKGARIWRGARQAQREGLPNVAFIRSRIEELALLFAPDEVAEIWITFPDPFLREGKAQKRLTSARFLALYQKVLRMGALLHLKTDEPNLYHFTLDTIAEQGGTLHYADPNIYTSPLPLPELDIKTYYEGLDIAQESTVKYIRFSLPSTPIVVSAKKNEE